MNEGGSAKISLRERLQRKMAEDHRQIEAATRAEMERFAGSLREELNKGLDSMKIDIQGWLSKTKGTFEQEVGEITAFLDRRVSQYESFLPRMTKEVEQIEARQKRAPLWTALLVLLGVGTVLVVIAVETEWRWRQTEELGRKTTEARKRAEIARKTLASTLAEIEAAKAELGRQTEKVSKARKDLTDLETRKTELSKQTVEIREELAVQEAMKVELGIGGFELKKYSEGRFLVMPRNADLKWCPGWRRGEEKSCVKLD